MVRAETVPMRDLARAVITGETTGGVKLVADAKTGRLLGGSVLAAGGGELLGEIALAIRLGLTCRAIADTLHAYPTFSEGVFWTAWELAKPQESRARGHARRRSAPWRRLRAGRGWSDLVTVGREVRSHHVCFPVVIVHHHTAS